VQRSTRAQAAIVFVVAVIPVAACGHKKSEESAAGNVSPPSSTQPSAVPGTSYSEPAARADSTKAPPKHHSKIAGAAAGAVAGHMVGHSVTGAAAGAVIQHERNKHKK
jgi:uncharacterized protein YcfJ